jgi:hypothetical protein
MLTTTPDRTLIRSAGGSRRYVLVTVTAPEAPRSEARTPVNIAFVLDRSGSMSGSKIRLAKSALVQALRMLRPSDRFSVVFYDNEIDLIVPSTTGSGEAIENAIRQVERIQARGNTNLAGGWLKGCEQIAEHLAGSQIARCLLLTDGLANEGITGIEEIGSHAAQLRARGIASSTFGIGQDFNEALLQRLADAGGGHSYHIEDAAQIGDYLTSELGETLEIVARGVTLQVRALPGVQVAPLNPFDTRRADDLTTEIGLRDLVSRQVLSIVVRLRFPAGQEGASSSALFSLSGACLGPPSPDADVVWTYAGQIENDRQPRNVVVDREVARLYAAKAREEAVELNRQGRYEEAQRRLKTIAERIRQYAGEDSVIREILTELDEREVPYSAPLSASALKQESYAAYHLSRSRDPRGRSRKV